jgi:predicted MFS family arabinose efflux permease
VIVAVAVVGTFAFNFTVTLPLLARVTFHQRSAAQYGILMGCMGIGAVLGGLLVAHRSRPTPKLLALLAVAFGASMTMVAFAPTLLWAQIALVPTGACSIAFVSSANSMLQLNSGQQMRGRVMSLYSTAFLGTTPFGAPLVGILIAATNPRIGVFLGALLTLLTGLWLVLVLRQGNRRSLVLQST